MFKGLPGQPLLTAMGKIGGPFHILEPFGPDDGLHLKFKILADNQTDFISHRVKDRAAWSCSLFRITIKGAIPNGAYPLSRTRGEGYYFFRKTP